MPELSAEQRAYIDEATVGWMPEDRWFLEQEVRLLSKYRWTRHMVENPVRVLVHNVLFPFFHWRLYLERHNRRVGRWAGQLFAPYIASLEQSVVHVSEIQEAARKISEVV